MILFPRELLELIVAPLLKKLCDKATQNENCVGFFNVLSVVPGFMVSRTA